MVKVDVPGIKPVRRGARVYFYHRKTGERLPDEESARIARVVEINAGLAADTVADRTAEPGSVAALIAAYLAAPEFAELAPASKRLYRRQLEHLRDLWGPLPVARIRRRNVIVVRDSRAAQPASANMLLKVLRRLLGFAVDRELRPDNPAAGVPALKAGAGHRAWTPEQIQAFLEIAPPELALALRLGLDTGQRLGDVLRMSWADYDGSAIRVVQEKTGARLWIPATRELRAALDRVPRRGVPILGIKESTFRKRFARACAAAGLTGLTYHGLRYTAAARLAEAGCDLGQIAAITGHRSLAMLQKYTRDADQKRLASAAILKLERTQKQRPQKLPRRPAETDRK